LNPTNNEGTVRPQSLELINSRPSQEGPGPFLFSDDEIEIFELLADEKEKLMKGELQ